MVPIKIFGLNSTREYAKRVAHHIGMELTEHEEKLFDDGESYLKPVAGKAGNVRGHNVFVIQSLYGDEQESVSDKFMKLTIMCNALQMANARTITVVLPYLGWARQDRKTVSRAPITTKLVANLLQAAGATHALFIDTHNLAAEQNAFSIPIDNLETKNLFAQWCSEKLKNTDKVRVLSPDSGALGRVTRFRNALSHYLKENDIEICLFDKIRENDRVTGGRIIGDVENAEVIVPDDIISTGSTMGKACRAVTEYGGNVFAVCATHGLFCGNANDVFDELQTNILISDTIPPFRLNVINRTKVKVVDTTKMVADAIMRIHSGTGSISELLELH
jgi:ribose-phosphate pyrophosphokinase